MSNFINDNYVIDFPINHGTQVLIDRCEKADRENDYGLYQVTAEFLTTVETRDLYAVGEITAKQREIIERRYVL